MSGSEPRTCSQCGNVQAEGDFCERCGGQFPRPAAAAVAGGAAVGAAAAVGASPFAPPVPPPVAQAAPAPPVPATGAYPPPGSYPPATQGPFGGGPPRDGFFASLFDLSFHHFVTPKIIKVLFILALIGIGFGVLTMIIVGFARGFGMGILFLILAPIGGFVYILLARLWLEVVVVLFRIEEHTATMTEQNKK